MASIYDLSWARTSFAAKLILFAKSIVKQRRKINSIDASVKAAGCSALSSTYYSIAGTAAAQREALQKQKWGFLWTPLFLVTWMPLGAWCWWRMLPLSDRVVELIGYDGMNADQCDIRQSILRRRGRLLQADGCIRYGLGKNASIHTFGLLYVGSADICMRSGTRQETERLTRVALEYARRAEQTDARQAGRIYRQCAPIADWLHLPSPLTAAELYQKAEILAIATDARDQLLKMQK